MVEIELFFLPLKVVVAKDFAFMFSVSVLGCRRLGEKPVGRKTLGRIIFWATDDWATTVISEKTFRRKTDG